MSERISEITTVYRSDMSTMGREVGISERKESRKRYFILTSDMSDLGRMDVPGVISNPTTNLDH